MFLFFFFFSHPDKPLRASWQWSKGTALVMKLKRVKKRRHHLLPTHMWYIYSLKQIIYWEQLFGNIRVCGLLAELWGLDVVDINALSGQRIIAQCLLSQNTFHNLLSKIAYINPVSVKTLLTKQLQGSFLS